MSEREKDLVKLLVKKMKMKMKNVTITEACRGGGGGVLYLQPECLCRLFQALPSLSQFWPREVVSCRDFILAHRRYFLSDVACRNLPLQGLIARLLLQGLLLHLSHTTIFSRIHFFTVTRDPSPHVRRQTFRPCLHTVNIRSCIRSC